MKFSVNATPLIMYYFINKYNPFKDIFLTKTTNKNQLPLL